MSRSKIFNLFIVIACKMGALLMHFFVDAVLIKGTPLFPHCYVTVKSTENAVWLNHKILFAFLYQ